MKQHSTKYVPLALVTALAAGSCHHHRRNLPPTLISPIPAQTVQEAATFTLPLRQFFSDPENDPLTLTARGPEQPGTPSIVNESYVYTDTEDPDLGNNPYRVIVTATDNHGNATTTEFPLTQIDVLPARVQPTVISLSSGLEGRILDTIEGSHGLFRRPQTAVGVTSHPAPMVVYRTASSFPGTTIVSGDLVSAHPAQQNSATPWIIKQIHSNAGSYLSLQFDSSNNGHLAFDRDAFSGGEDLMYGMFEKEVWNVGEWTTTLIREGGRVGLENDLAVDANGNVHISHLEWAANRVGYATNATSTAFTNTKSIALADWNQTSIAVDQNNVPHIVFSGFSNTVQYLKRDPTTRRWSQPEIVHAGSNPVIRSDATGLLHIISENQGMLQHTSRSGPTWITTPLIGGLNPHNKLAAAIDATDNSMHVGYISGGNLWYTRGNQGIWNHGMLDQGNYGNPNIALDKQGNVYVSAIRGNQVLFTSFPSYQVLP